MAQIPKDLEHLWRDHAGARWLIPMIAVLALVVIGIFLMLVHPYVTT